MLHSRVLWKVHSKDHPVAVTYINNDTATDCSHTTLLDSTVGTNRCPKNPDDFIESDVARAHQRAHSATDG
jgi:hypothetical protein